MKKTLTHNEFPLFRLTLAAGMVLALLLSGCAGGTEETPTEDTAAQTAETQQQEEQEVLSVSVITPNGHDNTAFLNLLGTVEADSNVRVFPATSGQIAQVNVKEGETVQKGEVLFVLGGVNGVEHPSMTQYKVAQANYNAALTAYNNTVASTQAAVKSAELQLQSAQHQTEGSYIDYNNFSENLASAKDSIALIRTNLTETQLKNQRDLNNVLDAIDDLEDDRDEAISDLKDARKEAVLDLEEMIDNAPDEATQAELEHQLKDTKEQFDDQIDDLEDQFDTQIEQLEDQYDTLQSASVLSENQLKAQLAQAYDQEHGLNTTRDSTQAKLGLYDGMSDQLLLAQQGLNSSVAQANTALSQAKTQRDIAAINLQSAADQQQLLLVKAPVTGVVGDVSAHQGDVVSQQAPLTEIIGSNSFALDVSVDVENSQKLSLTEMAQVKIGGKYMKVPVRTISPSVDPQSRLVNVTVELPNITFLPNQSIEVRLPINAAGTNGSSFIPLDAVTIGSERQFVYVVKDGKAHQATVELGAINGDLVEILSGLEEGAQVIVDGAKRVSEGQPVTIV